MLREQITYPNLPLAVYREVAAHLRQVRGVGAVLIPQTSQQFDYCQSQVGGLQVEYASDIESQVRQQVEEILSYYAEIYGACDRVSSN
jgi:hypothetical protein